MPNVTLAMAEWAASVTYEDLPAEVYNFSYDPDTGARLVVSPTLTLVGQQAG